MKKFILFTTIFLLSLTWGIAQVGINSDNSPPDNSAMLDVKSTSKGMLVPRMTFAQRDAISSPATGLLVFCTDNNQFYTNQGTPAIPSWTMMASATSSSQWINSGSNIYYNLGNVGIGEPNPGYPLNFGSSLGDKISLYGTTANHYGFGIQGNKLQIHGDGPSSDIVFGYGSSAAFTETVRIKGNGMVSIGDPLPSAPLSFGAAAGRKIKLAGFLGYDFGLGIDDDVTAMQLYSMSPATDIVFGWRQAGFNEKVRIKGTGQVGVGTSEPASSAALDITSSTKGFLPPRMTSVQINAIPSPAEGLTIYNTDLKSLCWYNGTAWTHGNDGQSCGTVNYGGKIYQGVIFGFQCWFRENLNIGTMINGLNNQTNNPVFEKYCYGNSEANCDEYGGLYQWEEMMNYQTPSNSIPSGIQGICPVGWHIPSAAEWDILINYLGGSAVAGGAMKETGTAHWSGPNTGATNISGFTALAGGFRIYTLIPAFTLLGHMTPVWTTTIDDESYGHPRFAQILYDTPTVFLLFNSKLDGYSCRCLKN